MSVLLPCYPRLHALIGDAVRELPTALAEKMEDALCDAAENAPTPAFFTVLDDHGRGHCADGEPWSELRLTPGRALDLARATRSLSGVSAVLAVLHAAHVAREDDGPALQPKAHVVDGLFRACAALSEQAERCLRP
ncbi:hypothetical protein [Stenotrophomonas sp. 24(2023)]|uniref:hypothetical protein n=1 Tax=Stenotrophomonas sp. 24(2023) TaxID=3068324 RepID=UPI0027DFC07C|nr:hypothetical protein [Stenotrophomonas sp. 24(2023)]WMJ69647.1 hypothetical protein Q9R17_00625 [Stenotrophomonas sp. 24(2023)]